MSRGPLRKTVDLLVFGVGWYADHCSCTRPDARDPECAVHRQNRDKPPEDR